MQNSKHTILLLLTMLTVLVSFAQNSEEFTSRPTGRGQYSLVLYASGGMGFFASNVGAPDYLRPTVSRLNPVGTLRVMWHPDHLLKAGLETGYINFYSYHLQDSAGKKGRIALNATPVLLEWSMSLKNRINIFAGSGIYLLKTKLDYAGTVNSNKLSVGWMAAMSYIYPIGKETGIGTEIKWLYAAETSNGSFCGQLQFVWRFLKW